MKGKVKVMKDKIKVIGGILLFYGIIALITYFYTLRIEQLIEMGY